MAVVENAPNTTKQEAWQQTKLTKFFFKMPLYAWRMGWKFSLPPTFACITTRGRKSGEARHTMVEHAVIGGNYYVVSGWQDKAQWVKNLLADPRVTLQPAHGATVAGMAQRTLDDATLTQLYTAMQASPVWESWLESQGIQPEVTDFLAKKEQVYIFEIAPAGEPELPVLGVDLTWVNWLVLGGVALLVASRLLARKPVKEEAVTKESTAQ